MKPETSKHTIWSFLIRTPPKVRLVHTVRDQSRLMTWGGGGGGWRLPTTQQQVSLSFFNVSEYSASCVSQRDPVLFVVILESRSYFTLIFYVNLDFPAGKTLIYSLGVNDTWRKCACGWKGLALVVCVKWHHKNVCDLKNNFTLAVIRERCWTARPEIHITVYCHTCLDYVNNLVLIGPDLQILHLTGASWLSVS